MQQKTIDKLKNNPFYKPRPEQLIPDGQEDNVTPLQNVKTFGVVPKTFTTPPKQHIEPPTITHAPPRPVPASTATSTVKPKRQRKSRSKK